MEGNDPIKEFQEERKLEMQRMAQDRDLKEKSHDWLLKASSYKYGYNFSWLGRPIIQLPADIMALQEIIWEVKPELIIETGVAHGGSIIFSASMLELVGGEGQVVGIDIDIRSHNRKEIESHPMAKRIVLLEGSSDDLKIIQQVEELAKGKSRVMVLLDSNHTHEHVLRELELYSRFVSLDSYLVVFDTLVEHFPDESFTDRPWGVGNNPWTAVQDFLSQNKNFVVDEILESKLLLSSCPGGYLKRIK